MSENMKSTAMMFTDIVGYSSMISKDQKHALKLLEMHDKIVDPIIEQNKGKIIKKIGDAIFAEFADSSSCIQSAITIQNALFDRNKVSSKKDLITIRIGLHSGNVIRKDNDLFGHDVNLCSRIESVATHGSIAASYDIMQEVKGDDFYSREMGYIKFKNIPQPKEIFKIYNNIEDYDNESSKELNENLVSNGVNIIDIDNYEVNNINSIGILYVQNLGEESDESIAYSITNDIINDIEYVNELRANSFNDIILFKNSELGIDDIARKLEVDAVLRGSILKKGDKINLSFDLLDLNQGKALWKDSWTELSINNKKIRKSILDSILNSYSISMNDELLELYKTEMTLNTEALDLFSSAQYSLEIIKSNEKLEEGKKQLESAMKLDPNFVELYSAHAFICNSLGMFEQAENSLQTGLNIAQKKENKIGESAIYNVFSIVKYKQGKYKDAKLYSEQAIEIQVSYSNRLQEAKFRTNYASALSALRLTDLSFEQSKISLQIKEDLEEFKSITNSYAILANTYFTINNFSEAKIYAMKALANSRKFGLNNLEFKILALITDILNGCANYQEMFKYINLAKKKFTEFNEPFIFAKIDFNTCQYHLYERDFDNALYYIDQAIENFEMSENKIYLIGALIEKLKIQVELNQIDKFEKLTKKIDNQLKKINDHSQKELFNVIKLFINKEKKLSDLKIYEDTLNNSFTMDNIYSLWYLSRAYNKLSNNSKAEKLHGKAKKLLEKYVNLNTDKIDIASSLENNYFNVRILEDLNKKHIPEQQIINSRLENFEKNISDKNIVTSKTVFLFCPMCGYENKNNYSYCPSCGLDLKPYCDNCGRGNIRLTS